MSSAPSKAQDRRRSAAAERPQRCWPGAAMFLLVFPLAQGHSLGWPAVALRDAGRVGARAGLLRLVPDPPPASGGVSTVDLLAPMVAGGIGMGMVFVPLFDIVMAGVRPHEMGSASGVLQTVNSLGMSLGIAGIGAIFFALAAGHGGHVPGAAEWTALATAGLLACSFVVAFGLPRRAREQ